MSNQTEEELRRSKIIREQLKGGLLKYDRPDEPAAPAEDWNAIGDFESEQREIVQRLHSSILKDDDPFGPAAPLEDWESLKFFSPPMDANKNS